MGATVRCGSRGPSPTSPGSDRVAREHVITALGFRSDAAAGSGVAA